MKLNPGGAKVKPTTLQAKKKKGCCFDRDKCITNFSRISCEDRYVLIMKTAITLKKCTVKCYCT